MVMWQNGWAWDARHQYWIRYQRDIESQCEWFHSWRPLSDEEMDKWANKGWRFNYLRMRWDYQHGDHHVDLTPYPNTKVVHYPQFKMPTDVSVLNAAYRDFFYYAEVPPEGTYPSSETAPGDLVNCPSTGILP